MPRAHPRSANGRRRRLRPSPAVSARRRATDRRGVRAPPRDRWRAAPRAPGQQAELLARSASVPAPAGRAAVAGRRGRPVPTAKAASPPSKGLHGSSRAAAPASHRRAGVSHGAWQAVALDGRVGAGQHPDRAFGRGEPPQRVRQIADRRAVAGEKTDFLQHRGETFLRQKRLCGPCRQPAPAEQQKTGRANGQKIAGAGEEQGIAQRRFILGAPRLPRRHRGGGEREALPPGAGPLFVAADNRIEHGDGRAGGKGSILKGLRRLDRLAQPGWYRRRGSGQPEPGRLGMVARGRCGAENHPRQDESTRRFLLGVTAKTAAPVDRLSCPVSLPCRTYRQKREKSVRVLAHHPSAEIHLLRHSRTGSVQAPACRFAFGNREMNGCKPSRPAMTRRPDRSHARNRSDRCWRYTDARRSADPRPACWGWPKARVLVRGSSSKGAYALANRSKPGNAYLLSAGGPTLIQRFA